MQGQEEDTRVEKGEGQREEDTEGEKNKGHEDKR